jgi:hypothetical protein
MVEISLSGSGEGLGRAIARGYSTTALPPAAVRVTAIASKPRAGRDADLASRPM